MILYSTVHLLPRSSSLFAFHNVVNFISHPLFTVTLMIAQSGSDGSGDRSTVLARSKSARHDYPCSHPLTSLSGWLSNVDARLGVLYCSVLSPPCLSFCVAFAFAFHFAFRFAFFGIPARIQPRRKGRSLSPFSEKQRLVCASLQQSALSRAERQSLSLSLSPFPGLLSFQIKCPLALPLSLTRFSSTRISMA